MARAKRKKPHNPAKIHDRRSRDLLRNAEVAAIEVDDPLALQLLFLKASESMGNHDSEVVGACSVD